MESTKPPEEVMDNKDDEKNDEKDDEKDDTKGSDFERLVEEIYE